MVEYGIMPCPLFLGTLVWPEESIMVFESPTGCIYKLGVRLVGVVVTRALLFGVYVGARSFGNSCWGFRIYDHTVEY